jgi:hypothetical protein
MENPPLRLEWLDPAQLADNPANWKYHPPEQRAAFGELKSKVGWAGAALLNERTGKLLDGHMRKGMTASEGAPVPVLIGSWDEEQERLILASLDPTGWMAIGDRRKLNDLLAGPMPSLQSKEMTDLLAAVKSTSKLLDQAEPDKRQDDEPLDVSIALDAIWPTDNPWSVPSLLPELAADQVPGPVTTWGTVGARRPMAGTWHFYTHDHKFEPLWKKPHRVLYSRPAAVVEPNFSTTDQTPFALALWHIYRKRWLGRYWQQCGLRLFVDLNVDASLNAPHGGVHGARPNLLGVPAGWGAYSTRAHGNDPEALVGEWAIAREHSGKDHPLMLVIGGGKAVQKLAGEHGWAWVPEQIQAAHPESEAGE